MNYNLSLKDMNPKLAKECEETFKETRKQIKRLSKIYKVNMIYDEDTRQERNDTIKVQAQNKRQAKNEAINRAIRHNNSNGESIGVVGIEKQSKYIGSGNWSYKKLNI